MNERDFEWISAEIKREAGIEVPSDKRDMVASRIRKRMKERGFPDFESYKKELQSEDGGRSLEEFISTLTTNTTRFAREPHHFSYLEDVFLPKISAKINSGERVRIWSAGCSSGEEPFEIASRLFCKCPQIKTADLRILATDIDAEVLRCAKTGRFSMSRIDGIANPVRDQCLQDYELGDEGFSFKPEIANLITFRKLNLHGSWPFTGKFDLIFCRNVAIYFSRDGQEKLWHKLAERLVNGGVLMMGHSESLPEQVEESLQKVASGIYVCST